MNEPENQRVDHATGFVSTALTFWEKLDDGDFEQFCTDWLNFHPTLLCQRNGKIEKLRVVSASRLLSGTSQRGADNFQVREKILRELWLSACGGGRSFTNNQLNPEYHYIRKDAERLAGEYASDPLLSPFYKSIIASEDHDAEVNKRMFGSEEDDLE